MKSIHFWVVELEMVILMSSGRENEKVLKIGDKQSSEVMFLFLVSIAFGSTVLIHVMFVVWVTTWIIVKTQYSMILPNKYCSTCILFYEIVLKVDLLLSIVVCIFMMVL